MSKFKEIIKNTKRSSEWISCLNNGNGYAYKFDEFSDGSYVEAIESINWLEATGEGKKNRYNIQSGSIILNENFIDDDSRLNDFGDIVFQCLSYAGVESHYGGGDMVKIKSNPDKYIENNYFN